MCRQLIDSVEQYFPSCHDITHITSLSIFFGFFITADRRYLQKAIYVCTETSVSPINLIELRRDRLSMMSVSMFSLSLVRFPVKAYGASIFLRYKCTPKCAIKSHVKKPRWCIIIFQNLPIVSKYSRKSHSTANRSFTFVLYFQRKYALSCFIYNFESRPLLLRAVRLRGSQFSQNISQHFTAPCRYYYRRFTVVIHFSSFVEDSKNTDPFPPLRSEKLLKYFF